MGKENASQLGGTSFHGGLVGIALDIGVAMACRGLLSKLSAQGREGRSPRLSSQLPTWAAVASSETEALSGCPGRSATIH